jgi:hypothetical protein
MVSETEIVPVFTKKEYGNVSTNFDLLETADVSHYHRSQSCD